MATEIAQDKNLIVVQSATQRLLNERLAEDKEIEASQTRVEGTLQRAAHAKNFYEATNPFRQIQ